MAHRDFRSNEIAFLQEQNRQVLQSLEKAEEDRDDALEVIQACEEKDASLQAELGSVKDKITALGQRIQQDKSETIAKDEHVKLLSEQNKQMIAMLEAEEKKSSDFGDKIRELEGRNKKLQRIAEEFDVAKAKIEKQVAEAKAKGADTVAGVKSQRSSNETLRVNIQNTEAKTRVEIEALQQSLQVVENKNMEYLTRINRQEAKKKQLEAETETLKQEVDKLRSEIDQLRDQLQGDQEGRQEFERIRGQAESAIEALEVQADTLKKALNTAERANEQLQDENRKASEQCRETADKVYALMDSLRLNQVELKKQEAENGARDKKLLSLERSIQNLQAKISMEVDAKTLAEQEKKDAEQETSALKKKNKKVEEAVAQSQAEQEKAEKAIADVNEKVTQLQTQNAFLASKLDGQEEEKNSAKAEIKKVADRIGQLTAENTKHRNDIDRLEEQVARATSEKQQVQKELEYIKREDVLDEAGRQRPILIQSTDSDLLEKLQVNEFLYEAQQSRNPVPPLIEKIAQLLAMLHEGQGRCDQYLGDLSKSNSLVSALRQRNMALFTRTQMFEAFKTRALIRYVMNLVEGDEVSDLHLDGLNFGPREINEMVAVLQRYDATDKIYVICLVDNGLGEDAINLLMQLVFLLPYLKLLDLRRNCISQHGIKVIEDSLREMQGVTSVIRTANQVLNCHSGNQLRLTVDLSEQVPKEHVTPDVDFSVQHELSHQDADPFLASDAGQSQHPWTKTGMSSTQRSSMQVDAIIPDLTKPGAGMDQPVLGGPPVGLGGPGNLASLSRKATDKKGRDGAAAAKNRSARRTKAREAGDQAVGRSTSRRPSSHRSNDSHRSGEERRQRRPPR